MKTSWTPYVEPPVPQEEAAVANLECTMNIRIPDEFRAVFLEHGGDAASPDRIPIGSKSGTAFGPILYVGGQKAHADYTYSVEWAVETLAQWSKCDGLASLKLLPFATNTATGYFCFDYRDQLTNPPIVFVDISYDFAEKVAVLPVAENWADLVSKLH
ncbi:SMI1/KNR4 family protein [Qipengyuania qiaonensis]|uniref:SMI1/KNR4 family protein n=1 Tax=Qipengyuania qiaonensis TaxID=2867240 RepID=A0ABS7J8T9_9SPHN|nr:SMI1/KNR4 family protein [Qipengyuania qiaonensis]MBX7482731.1 SMI1/KNR4 family protein [Qipengyuania qiaonensis]